MSLCIILYDNICTHCNRRDDVWSLNITHNLTQMATAAKIYYTLWRPEEINIEYTNQILPQLEKGLARLLSDPEKFKKYNPTNGWGSYETLVGFIEKYIKACKDFPNAKIVAER